MAYERTDSRPVHAPDEPELAERAERTAQELAAAAHNDH